MTQYRSKGLYAAMGAGALLLTMAAVPAYAQVPGGSYLRTCTNVRASGDRVVAECRRVDGRWERTALADVDSCVGGIANTNGRLTCDRGGRGAYRGHYRGWDGYGSSYRPYNGYGRWGDYYGYGR